MRPKSLPSGKIDKFDIIIAMRIHILVLDEVFDTGLSALLDTLRIANDLPDTAGASSTRFDVSLVGVRRRVRTTQGLAVPVAPALTAAQPGVVLFPALGAKNPEPLQATLSSGAM